MSHDGETAPLLSWADGTQATKIPVEVCASGYACGGITWGTPEDAKTKVSCIKIPDPTPLTGVVPGDMCSKDTECYNNAGGVKCTGGKCVTTVKEGDDCTTDGNADHKKCPENNYCDAGTKKCVKTIALGADCDQTKPCSSGLGCFGNADQSKYTCQEVFKAPLGTQFYADKLFNPALLVISKFSFCDSYHTLDTGAKSECRTGDTSDDKTETALVRTASDAKCTFVKYNDAADKSKAVAADEPPKCGFNTDGNWYCNKRKGDSYFQNTYTNMKKLDLKTYTCHINSQWSTCLSFAAQNKNLLQDVTKRLLEVGDGGYAKYANNDKCVKNSITIGYWGTVDSSFGYSVVSTLTAVLAIVSIIVLF